MKILISLICVLVGLVLVGCPSEAPSNALAKPKAETPVDLEAPVEPASAKPVEPASAKPAEPASAKPAEPIPVTPPEEFQAQEEPSEAPTRRPAKPTFSLEELTGGLAFDEIDPTVGKPTVKETGRAPSRASSGAASQGVDSGRSKEFDRIIQKHCGPFFAAIHGHMKAGTLTADVIQDQQRALIERMKPEIKKGRYTRAEIATGVDRMLESLRDQRRGPIEQIAQGRLRLILVGQALYREADRDRDGRKNYASSLAELGRVRLFDGVTAEGKVVDYRFSMRATRKRNAFMIVATPEDPKCRYFVVNQDEKIFASSHRISFTKDCSIPKGLSPVR